MRTLTAVAVLAALGFMAAAPTQAGPDTNPLDNNQAGAFHGADRPGLTGTASAGQNDNAFGGGGEIHGIDPGRQAGATKANQGQPARDKHGGLAGNNPGQCARRFGCCPRDLAVPRPDNGTGALAWPSREINP